MMVVLGAVAYSLPRASGSRLIAVMGSYPSQSTQVLLISKGVSCALPSPKSGLELDLLIWDRDGTEGSFLTLEQNRETNTFCLLAEGIAVNERLSAKALLVPARPSQRQAWLD